MLGICGCRCMVGRGTRFIGKCGPTTPYKERLAHKKQHDVRHRFCETENSIYEMNRDVAKDNINIQKHVKTSN